MLGNIKRKNCHSFTAYKNSAQTQRHGMKFKKKSYLFLENQHKNILVCCELKQYSMRTWTQPPQKYVDGVELKGKVGVVAKGEATLTEYVCFTVRKSSCGPKHHLYLLYKSLSCPFDFSGLGFYS